MPTNTQTLRKEATNAALRYSRGKLRSSAMMSFTLSPSLSGQRHPKSPPVWLERRHDTMTHLPNQAFFAPLADQRGAGQDPRPQPGLARRRRALDRRIRAPDRRAQPEKVVFV